MILVPAKLHCDECNDMFECELESMPNGMRIPIMNGRPTIPGWEVDYIATNGRQDLGIGGMGALTEAPQVTCSDDCRKVIDARKRLQGSEQEGRVTIQKVVGHFSDFVAQKIPRRRTMPVSPRPFITGKTKDKKNEM